MQQITVTRPEAIEAINAYLRSKGLNPIGFKKFPNGPFFFNCSDDSGAIDINQRFFVRCYPFHFRFLYVPDQEKIKSLIHEVFNTFSTADRNTVTIFFGLNGKPRKNQKVLAEELKIGTPVEIKRKIDALVKIIRNYTEKQYVPSVLSLDKPALKKLTGREFKGIDRSGSRICFDYDRHTERFFEQWKSSTPTERFEKIQKLFLR